MQLLLARHLVIQILAVMSRTSQGFYDLNLKSLHGIEAISQPHINFRFDMRPYILAETNWKHIKDASFDVAVLPWGACEAHNYHMPYCTDIIESEFVSAEAARIATERGAKVIVLPPVPFGVNT